MDSKVNDFFNEINQLSSKSAMNESSREVWQECYDDLTGCSYFWNTETDKVTWDPPKSYKPAEGGSTRGKPSKPSVERTKTELFVPPTSVAQFPITNLKPEKVRVYSLHEVLKPTVSKLQSKNAATTVKKRPRTNSESDDEKIELITEYGGDSSTDEEDNAKANSTVSKCKIISELSPKRPEKSIASDNEEEDDDDIDLLAKIQQKAQELQKLGGQVPSSVKNLIEAPIKSEKNTGSNGISLVAGYESEPSDHEEEESAPKPIFPFAISPKPVPETAHSTLFPITKPIDVKDFIGPDIETSRETKDTESVTGATSEFDNKLFKRKRRIGVSLVNNAKRLKDVDEKSEFTGLGFKTNNEENNESQMNKDEKSNLYAGFQKGGVMFVKSDVASSGPEGKQDECQESINKKETEDDYQILKEKLLFLGEGREPVLPVQVMLIQAEMLFVAMTAGGLKLSYLHNWLKETCSELIKLEKEAAPDGWILQWDRSHKRYFYQNQSTGVNQWHYPEPDVTRCDDAMDICTTPPPSDLKNDIPSLEEVGCFPTTVLGPQLPVEPPPLPPTPPKIRSPTPPPPPVISGSGIGKSKSGRLDVPLPPDQQPLAPAIGSVKSSNDSLSTVLDSFYSEIAEVTENTNSSSPTSTSQKPETSSELAQEPVGQSISEVAKKKKKKGKFVHGLTMKKKGVSQLVEKWKSVQKSYDD